MKWFSVLLAVGCLAPAAAQQWQVELVDTSCRPPDVFVKRDSGRTYVAYVGGDGSIRIASNDTAWSYENVDTVLVHPDPYAGFHFALGPAGRMAVSGLDDSLKPVVLQRSDSGWVCIWTHGVLGIYCLLARAAYGDDSIPVVVYGAQDFLYTRVDIVVERREDSVWAADTAWSLDPPGECELELCDAGCSPEAGPHFLFQFAYGYSARGKGPWWYGLFQADHSGGEWAIVLLDSGTGAVIRGYDVAADAAGTVHSAYYFDRYLRFDRNPVWLERVADASIQVDGAGREQIAFVTQDSVLRFGFKDTRWHFYEVPGVTTATCCDLALDDAGQPLIACEDANGVSLVHGIDVVGVSESPKPQAPSRKPAATVARKLPPGATVFHAMGRRVLSPRSGVLFVREPSAVGGQPSAVTKVVILR